VRPAATGAGDGSSWNDATTLQDALATANSGAEIWVAAGVYSPGSDFRDAFTLVEGVAVYGGFAGTETDRSQHDAAYCRESHSASWIAVIAWRTLIAGASLTCVLVMQPALSHKNQKQSIGEAEAGVKTAPPPACCPAFLKWKTHPDAPPGSLLYHRRHPRSAAAAPMLWAIR
jgi:hypothetical protein